ncbi:hypothetical protein HK100_012325 [Physocladia obscura]|uniref:Carrier domain-containing protein n=1 Tax=Physocladia obscura TaxID=109957 RepID=A0AAD5SZX4_9FUNG|nr:hypothetical protein HK100_012325 [Physocladia obscura]
MKTNKNSEESLGRMVVGISAVQAALESETSGTFGADIGSVTTSTHVTFAEQKSSVETYHTEYVRDYSYQSAKTSLGDHIASNLHFYSLLDVLFPDSDIPAIRSIDSRQLLSHSSLFHLIEQTVLPVPQLQRSSRVGVLLSEGPELASCLLTVMANCCAVPINYDLTNVEILAELTCLGACACILEYSRSSESIASLLAESGIVPVFLISNSSYAGVFSLVLNPEEQILLSSYNIEPYMISPAKIQDDRLFLPSWIIMDRSIYTKFVQILFIRHSRTRRRILYLDRLAKDEVLKQYPVRVILLVLLFLKAHCPDNVALVALYLARMARCHDLGNSYREDLTEPNDIVMILRTSGTSGNKKTVPYTLKTLIVGAKCVADTWELKAGKDINLNMMPLYHVGGIVRNLLAPMVSQSTVIITPGFDAQAFWDILQNYSPTWYYAVPTMHMAILDQGNELMKIHHGHKKSNGMSTSIRMIANAGGGLPHSLAVRLREMFQESTVLPSYGMTECMPIASPPIGYKLEKPGCSGIAVGPEIAIMNGNNELLGAAEFGKIMVRGWPVFGGYENDAKANELSFTKDGFFDTGDMGYLDKDGYLFITGRSKEIINRGGETVSPVEIEDAVLAHPKIATCLAFSVPHNTLQETIGVVIVLKSGVTRVGLSQLQKFVGDKLHPTKWPQLVVFMDDLPKNMTNKPLRIKLADRLGLNEITDTTPIFERIYEAQCPVKGSPITEPIICHKAPGVELKQLQNIFGLMESITEYYIFEESEGKFAVLAAGSNISEGSIIQYLSQHIHEYLIPTGIVVVEQIPKNKTGDVDSSVSRKIFEEATNESMNLFERKVGELFLEVLGLEKIPKKSADFFEIGGSSMAVGKIMAIIRSRFGMKLSPTVLIKNRTCELFALALSKNLEFTKKILDGNEGLPQNDFVAPDVLSKSPTSIAALVIQILPLFLFRPIRVATAYLLFTQFICIWDDFLFYPLTEYRGTVAGTFGIIALLIISSLSAAFCVSIADPIICIASKWLIIGTYKTGRYPLWGQYYLRWWLVDQIQSIYTRGIFSLTETTKIFYMRLMGAKIAWNVQMAPDFVIREYDLIKIHSNCVIGTSSLRSFTVEPGLMVLKSIVLGENCAINAKCTIAAGSKLPPDTVLPPLSSSHELFESNPKYRIFVQTAANEPNFLILLFFAWPVMGFVKLFSALPWIGVIYWLLQFPFFPDEDQYLSLDTFARLVVHQTEPYRIGIFLLAAVTKVICAPWFELAAVIFVKRWILGKFTEGQKIETQWYLTKSYIMYNIVGLGGLCGVYDLLGRHYEGISILYRLLGAKIGKRVYWPGTPMRISEFDLLEVGDDVVFGSRSALQFTDAIESRKIVIESGAMLADRCIVLPGVLICKNATIGSGSLLSKNGYYPPGSTWIGSKDGDAVLWEEGTPESAVQPTLKPFGKAFYLKDAKFTIYSQFFIFFYNVIFSVCASVIWAAVPLSGIMVSGYIYRGEVKHYINTHHQQLLIGAIFIFTIVVAYNIAQILAFLISISAKWIVIGKREAGSYDWDKSSYCQRWQITISLQQALEPSLGSIRGSHYLVSYFRSLGCSIGEHVCLYPTGADPMMTEPDLLTIGDHSVVENASLICHINSKGNFALNKLKVGSWCSMASDSRLLSGAEMSDGSRLMEHTLVIGGEVVDSGAIMQGWPADEVRPLTAEGRQLSKT